MTWQKNILVVIALLAVMLLCSHAVEQHDDCDYGFAEELWDCVGTYCNCYTSNHLPCANKQQVQFKCPTAPKKVHAATDVLVGDRFYLSEHKQATKPHHPLVSGVLASILTVQLLI